LIFIPLAEGVAGKAIEIELEANDDIVVFVLEWVPGLAYAEPMKWS
jgi:hypothetical protein